MVATSYEYQGSLDLPDCQKGGSFPKLKDPKTFFVFSYGMF